MCLAAYRTLAGKEDRYPADWTGKEWLDAGLVMCYLRSLLTDCPIVFAPKHTRRAPTSMFWGANNLTSFDSLYREKAKILSLLLKLHSIGPFEWKWTNGKCRQMDKWTFHWQK